MSLGRTEFDIVLDTAKEVAWQTEKFFPVCGLCDGDGEQQSVTNGALWSQI